MPGILYLVATPIGNLEDMTLRAARVLREVDAIACEDTRETRKLLEHFGIATRMVSYHEHNEVARAAELLERMRGGETIALVSDAGTPLVSDPGYRVVRAAIEAGITVVPIPGASAAMTALAGSGLATDAFRFGGFLPAKKMARRRALENLRAEDSTLIFYEAPHRILETLEDIGEVMGDRPVVVARELTKIHEEFLRGTAEEIRGELAARAAIRGEMTVLIGKGGGVADDRPVEEAVAELERAGVSRMEAIKRVAKDRGVGKRHLYKELLK
ncbi:MAG TPA: 16S rRNA (cytidine(1402)-2'-O)-methyltransferase [Bryobacteraceae bacterium]|nr:16S rRNA (cytidine(1402)-2'-O)-methyltransferase [Bryobacteraceae bacterium]